MSTRNKRAGIDIGGTFTDLLLFDESTGDFRFGKTLTTSGNPAEGVLNGIRQFIDEGELDPADLDLIIHGTTLVTNALIERKGSKTALITTRGFRDAIEIGREHRYDLYDLFIELPPPLAPRDLRFEVTERLYSDGSVSLPHNDHELIDHIDTMRGAGVEAVAVCYLHSYQNDVHEQQAVALLQAYFPEATVSASSDVVPEIREYERASTTIANVYVRPLVQRYLKELVDSLQEIGFDGSFMVMLSSGGLSTVETASVHPIRLLESGPAAGALAAAHFGKQTGRPDLLSFDMGGTTAKCCLIDDGKPSVSAEFEVSRVYRFKRGSGLPVKAPVIEMIEIGAGGGSIARVDALGLLKVGPDSAGADPGPACYGRGGDNPTVTDADLLLGYLDADYFLGGTMQLHRHSAEVAVGRLAEVIGLSVLQTAWGIHDIVNEQMAGAARIHAIEQGKDPRSYPLFAFGGAGPVHAFGVATILRSPEMIVPFGAGIASTIGFLVAPLAFDFVRSYIGQLQELDWEQVNRRLDEMTTQGVSMLRAAGVPQQEIRSIRTAELRYVGQGHQVTISLPEDLLDSDAAEKVAAEFEQQYERIYGRVATGNPVEAINWRVGVAAPPQHLPLESLRSASANEGDLIKGERLIYLPELGQFGSTAVYNRYALKPGDRFEAPAIIEERESTLVVNRPAEIAVDELLSLVVH